MSFLYARTCRRQAEISEFLGRVGNDVSIRGSGYLLFTSEEEVDHSHIVLVSTDKVNQ